MRRRDDHEPRAPRLRESLRNAHSIRIDTNRHERRAEGAQGVAHRRIAGILDPDLIARLEQYARRQIKSALIAMGDQDLMPSAIDGARFRQISGDSLAQAL